MNVLKRLISLLLSAAICIQLVTTVSYAKQKTAGVERLSYLGLTSSEMLSGEGQLVTKQEFAKYLLTFLKQNNVSKSEKSYFYDVTSSNEYISYINRAVELNYIKVNIDKMFRPTDRISAKEAGDAIMRAMGYSAALDSMSVTSFASDIYSEITKNVDTKKDGITKKELLSMFNNSLDENMMMLEDIGNVKFSNDTAFLEGYFKVKTTSGKINATNMTSLDSEIECSQDEAAADGIVYKLSADITDINDYLGYWADIYYSENGGEKTILYYEIKDTDEIVIKADDFLSYKDGKISYTDDNYSRTRNVNLTKGFYVIYNGVLLDTFTSDIFNIDAGSIELVGKSGQYDVVKIYSYKDFVVGGVSDKKIYSKFTSEIIDTDQYDKLILRDRLGRGMDISEIEEDTVISFGKSADSTMIILNAYKETVTGILESVSYEPQGTVWTVNGKKYRAAESAELPNAEANMNVTLYLNYLGKIAYAQLSGSTSWTYAYLIKAYIDDSDTERACVKVYTEFGELKDYRLAEKAIIDGSRKNGYSAISALSYKNPGDLEPSDEVQPQLMKIKVNADGEIKNIDTARRGDNEKEKTTLSKDIYYEERRFMTETNRLFGLNSNEKMDCLVTDDTKVFIVPGNAAEARTEYDAYSVAGKSYFVREGIYDIDAYDIDYEKGARAGAVCVLLKSTIQELDTCPWENMMVVTEKNKVWSEKYEAVVTGVKGYQYSTGSRISLESISEKDIFANVEPGDIIRYGYVNSRLTTAKVDFDLSNHSNKSIHPTDASNYNGYHIFALYMLLPAKLVDMYGGYMYLDYTPTEKSTAAGCKFVFDVTADNIKAFTFNKSTNKLSEINKEELRDYKYSINKNAEFVVYASYGVPKMVVVYY